MRGLYQTLRRSRGIKRFILFSVKKMLQKKKLTQGLTLQKSVQNSIETIIINPIEADIIKPIEAFIMRPKSPVKLIIQDRDSQQHSSTNLHDQQNLNGHQNVLTQKKILQTTHYNSIGLINLGNTCYMYENVFQLRNAAIQIMINTTDLNEQLLQGNINNLLHPKNKGIALTYQSVMKSMWFNKTSQPYCPKQLKGIIANTIKKFRGYGQEDSQEFLRALLDLLHQDLNRVKTKVPYRELEADLQKHSLDQISTEWYEYFESRENSIVTDLFQGQLLNLVECQVCKNQSVAFDNFQDLSLSLPTNLKKIKIEDLLKEFFKKEVLTNSYNCSKCKKVSKSLRNFSLWRLPKNLIIHFKRFQFGPQSRKKIDMDISFPLSHFDLSEYSKNQSHVKYQLYGIIHHYGSLNYGHYTAECRNASDGKWYSLNDESVFPINISSKEYSTQGSSSPYVLLYKQSD